MLCLFTKEKNSMQTRREPPGKPVTCTKMLPVAQSSSSTSEALRCIASSAPSGDIRTAHRGGPSPTAWLIWWFEV